MVEIGGGSFSGNVSDGGLLAVIEVQVLTVVVRENQSQ